MSVSTTGFVLTEKKDVFEVLEVIDSTLIELVKKYSKQLFIHKDCTSKLPTIECRPITKCFSIYFRINDEGRILTVHFDCDCYYKEYGDSKIIWSVNNWGYGVPILSD
jgi:hypothetical protein